MHVTGDGDEHARSHVEEIAILVRTQMVDRTVENTQPQIQSKLESRLQSFFSNLPFLTNFSSREVVNSTRHELKSCFFLFEVVFF